MEHVLPTITKELYKLEFNSSGCEWKIDNSIDDDIFLNFLYFIVLIF